MRMWMIDPKRMCRQHLLGEHNEIHKMVGNLNKSGRWAKALTSRGFLEPQNAQKRHDTLAKEMLRRGYKHNSCLPELRTKLIGKVDIKRSTKDIMKRCQDCFQGVRLV